MILMGFNPDQRGEEGDPPAPSNSQSMSERDKLKQKKYTEPPSDEHGSSIQTEAGTEIHTYRVQMCRSVHRAQKTSQTSDQLSPSPSSRVLV